MYSVICLVRSFDMSSVRQVCISFVRPSLMSFVLSLLVMCCGYYFSYVCRSLVVYVLLYASVVSSFFSLVGSFTSFVISVFRYLVRSLVL